MNEKVSDYVTVARVQLLVLNVCVYMGNGYVRFNDDSWANIKKICNAHQIVPFPHICATIFCSTHDR